MSSSMRGIFHSRIQWSTSLQFRYDALLICPLFHSQSAANLSTYFISYLFLQNLLLNKHHPHFLTLSPCHPFPSHPLLILPHIIHPSPHLFLYSRLPKGPPLTPRPSFHIPLYLLLLIPLLSIPNQIHFLLNPPTLSPTIITILNQPPSHCPILSLPLLALPFHSFPLPIIVANINHLQHHRQILSPLPFILPYPSTLLLLLHSPLPILLSHLHTSSTPIPKPLYPHPHSVLDSFIVEPSNYLQGSKSPNWRQAMEAEYQALLHQKTWSLVPRSSSMNVILQAQVKA